MRYFLLLFLLPCFVFAQKATRFAKYDIPNTGFKIYLTVKPESPSVEYSPDSSKIYTLEVEDSTSGKSIHYGSILVELKDISLDGQEESLSIAYLDFLKQQFKIKESAGYGKGHTLSTHPTAKGVIDYWIDEDGLKWNIASWACEKYIVVMFAYGKTEPPHNIWEIFKNGIRFPNDN